MKIRNGFVSNSSSSSFIIDVDNLSANQLLAIQENDYKDQPYTDPWIVTVENGKVIGHTYMDNYSMADFLEKIKVPKEYIDWDEN